MRDKERGRTVLSDNIEAPVHKYSWPLSGPVAENRKNYEVRIRVRLR